MKREFRLTVAAIGATLPLLGAGAAQTITFGPSATFSPTTGTVPDGYAGFDWHGATNDVVSDLGTDLEWGYTSASITEMSRTAAFDLDSMTTVASYFPEDHELPSFSTVISGYYNGTLVKTVTEEQTSYYGGGNMAINMDGVNDIKFATTISILTYYYEGPPSLVSYPYVTLVSKMSVDNFSGAAKAPEIDPTATASALMLLLGSLLVIRGRPARDAAPDRRPL
jgi:hypothetical protein